MCGKPKVVQQDPEADAAKAAEKATLEANTKKAMRRATSISTLGSKPEATKTTLGGG